MFQLASVDIVHATTMVEMPSVNDAGVMPSGEGSVPPVFADEAAINFGYETDDATIEVAEDESAPPATGGQATTEFFGDSATSEGQAWAAPAKMNSDYTTDQAGEAQEPAAPAGEEQAAPSEGGAPADAAPAQVADDAAPPPTGGTATTEFFGDSPTSEGQPWAAPAKMNPDYTNAPAAPAESTQPAATEGGEQAAPSDSGNAASEAPAPAPAAEEAPPPPTGGTATTEFFGDSATSEGQAWNAPAKMNPDYNAAAPAPATEAAAPAADACREAVATAAKAVALHFGLDSAAIAQESQAALGDLAKALKDCGGVVVEVQGFTDSIGSPDTNRILSELRAKKIVDFLTDAGVEASKLRAVGRGEENPVADNGTAEGRRANRRVEIVITGQ
jgi:outer membrane protein OmpA-like peptidoglycan-associated protein